MFLWAKILLSAGLLALVQAAPLSNCPCSQRTESIINPSVAYQTTSGDPGSAQPRTGQYYPVPKILGPYCATGQASDLQEVPQQKLDAVIYDPVVNDPQVYGSYPPIQSQASFPVGQASARPASAGTYPGLSQPQGQPQATRVSGNPGIPQSRVLPAPMATSQPSISYHSIANPHQVPAAPRLVPHHQAIPRLQGGVQYVVPSQQQVQPAVQRTVPHSGPHRRLPHVTIYRRAGDPVSAPAANPNQGRRSYSANAQVPAVGHLAVAASAPVLTSSVPVNTVPCNCACH